MQDVLIEKICNCICYIVAYVPESWAWKVLPKDNVSVIGLISNRPLFPDFNGLLVMALKFLEGFGAGCYMKNVKFENGCRFSFTKYYHINV